MRFVSFITSEGIRKSGIINSQSKVVPFSSVKGVDEVNSVNELIDFIRKFDTGWPEVLSDSADLAVETYELNEVKLLSPIPQVQRNVICLGKNYADHVREIRTKIKDINGLPQFPIYFSKFANPAAGHEDDIFLDKNVTDQLDYEVELAVVIGKKCRNVKREDALKYIFGYTIINDLSARDIQQKHIQWFKGKNLDGFCPIGPWIVHSNDIPDPMNLKISCSVNGEIRQNSNTSNMIFDIPSIIEDLSSTLTLFPGDIISTGTPEGVGMGFDPPKYLKKGDIVECNIEKIGLLRNRIV